MAGIFFSDKLKDDGTASCKFIEGDEISFLNARMNISTGRVETDKG